MAEAFRSPNCQIENIKILNIGENEIDCVGMESLAQAFCSPTCKLKNLQTLDLFNNKISNEGIWIFANLFVSNDNKLKNLQTLILSYNKIDFNGIGALAEAFIHPNCKINLQTLDLGCIGYESNNALANTLNSSACKLKNLKIKIEQTKINSFKGEDRKRIIK